MQSNVNVITSCALKLAGYWVYGTSRPGHEQLLDLLNGRIRELRRTPRAAGAIVCVGKTARQAYTRDRLEAGSLHSTWR